MSEILNEENIEEELTEEELAEEKQQREKEKMQEWISILNALYVYQIPLESFEKPLVTLLSKIVNAEQDIESYQKGIKEHEEAIQVLQAEIMNEEAGQGYFYQVMEASYTEEQINEFIERIKELIKEKEGDRQGEDNA